MYKIIAFSKEWIKSWETEWKPLMDKYKSNAQSAAEEVYNNKNKYPLIGYDRIEEAQISGIIQGSKGVPPEQKDILKEVRKEKGRTAEVMTSIRIPIFFDILEEKHKKLYNSLEPRDLSSIKETLEESRGFGPLIKDLHKFLNIAAIREQYKDMFKRRKEFEEKIEKQKRPSPEWTKHLKRPLARKVVARFLKSFY